jgi:geranylgeranyl diphosphate synthase type II
LRLLKTDESAKVEKVLNLFKECGIDAWARELKEKYIEEAAKHMDDIAVLSVRKKPLLELMHYLVQRDK